LGGNFETIDDERVCRECRVSNLLLIVKLIEN
jgi:rubredoxin